MTRKWIAALAMLAAWPALDAAQAQIYKQLQPVPPPPKLSLGDKAGIIKKLGTLPGYTTFSEIVDLTIIHPYVDGRASLTLVRPDMVLPYAAGGNASLPGQSGGPPIAFAMINYTADSAKPHLIDCRFSGNGGSYRLGSGGVQISSGNFLPIAAGHVDFVAPAQAPGAKFNLMLWSTDSGGMVFFGCEITTIG